MERDGSCRGKGKDDGNYTWEDNGECMGINRFLTAEDKKGSRSGGKAFGNP